VWLARGLGPKQAQAVHELGLPGLGFRTELRRYYPLGPLAGHVLGAVNVDNRGLAGIERMLDEEGLIDPVRGAARSTRPAVRLALDLGVQHALVEELRRAVKQFGASAAAALVLDARTGEIVAAVSLPEIDPNRPGELLDPSLLDRLISGTFELGSVYKILTIALALDCGVADLDSVLDVRQPLRAGGHVIKDHYPQGRPLTVREVFLYSSNVGAGMLALQVGAERQRAFLAKLGLLDATRTEAGPVAPPQLPAAWGRTETHHHRLRSRPCCCTAAVRSCRRGRRQRRRDGGPDLPAARRRSGAGAARRVAGSERQHARADAPGGDPRGRDRAPGGGRGLRRRRQDRHGGDGGPRRLPGEGGDLLVPGLVSHGGAALRDPGAAV
jgi:cell division protein FtsI (penicillin-binding protein 3)